MEKGEQNRRHTITAAAIGFCELGMWQDAWDELETLEPEERSSPDVLRIRLGIFIALARYESAAVLAESMIARGEDSPITWLHGAYAIRRHRSLAEAKEFLIRAEACLGEHGTFQYNLACYECQLGNLPESRRRLANALRLNPALKAVALEDDDLEAIW